MSSYFVGVDVGSTSARACVIDDSGEMLASAACPIQTWQSQDKYYEQSTKDIWNSVCEAVKTVTNSAAIDVTLVKSIAFAATCSLAVFTHDTSEPVSMSNLAVGGDDHNVIFWMDRRADAETERINATKHELFNYLGGSISVEMALPKVLWLQDNLPPHLFRRCRFFDLSDALDYLAIGESRLPCGPACVNKKVTVGIDGTMKGWEKEFLTDIGLSPLTRNDFEQIGGVCKHGYYTTPGSAAGLLTREAANQLGLQAGVVVASGLIDAYAGWVGTAGADIAISGADQPVGIDERITAVAGTSTCFTALSKKSRYIEGIWGPYEDWMLPGHCMAAAGQPATGELLQYVLETHPAHSSAVAKAKGENQSIFDYLNGRLEQMRVANNAPSISYLGRHYFMYGDFFGNRSPIGDEKMSGSIAGITADKGLDNLDICYYGTLEFLAFQTRQIVDTLERGGYHFRAMLVSGSQCQNDLLMNLMATVLNIPVILQKYQTAAVCHGTAILAAEAARRPGDGRPKGLWATMTHMTKARKVIQPSQDKRLRDLLKVKYEVFQEQCERQQVFRQMVDGVT